MTRNFFRRAGAPMLLRRTRGSGFARRKSGGQNRTVCRNVAAQNLGIDIACVDKARMSRHHRVAITSGAHEAVDDHGVPACHIERRAADTCLQTAIGIAQQLHTRQVREPSRARIHVAYDGQVIECLPTRQVKGAQGVAKGLNLQDVLVGNDPGGQGVAYATRIDNGKVGARFVSIMA
jgi:hypothetical protein